MPKIKTHKATEKRFRKTKSKAKSASKTLKRKAGQGHFNSGERGKTTRQKRRDVEMTKTLIKTIKQLTPYS